MRASRRKQQFTTRQWLILLGLLAVLNIVVGGGLFWLLSDEPVPHGMPVQQIAFSALPTRTPFPTFTPDRKPNFVPPVVLTPRPTATNTRVPTWTPSITPTPSPTPTGTPIPPTHTPVPRPPTNTPPPTAAPPIAPVPVAVVPPPVTPTNAPDVDFTATLRQLTPCENQGNHHIFIKIHDAAGNGIPGVNVRISWIGGEATAVTGTKIEDPGLTDFAMFKGTYFVTLPDFKTDTIGPISPDIPEDQMCRENGNPVANSLYHYSFELIFTKVR